MVDRPRVQLDREWDGALLGELVTVQSQREPRPTARCEVPPRLCRIERAALEEHVGRLRDRRRLGEHLGEREVEVRVRVVELRWDGVRAEPRRHTAGGSDRAQ